MTDLTFLPQLFQDGGEDRFFCIPDYQRGYSWEEPQRNDLLADLAEVLRHGQNHFTGTIVAARPQEDDRYPVVDGQQRLTSLVLLIGRLLLKVEELSARGGLDTHWDVEGLRDLFVQQSLGPGNSRLRLQPNGGAEELFKKLVSARELEGAPAAPENKTEANLRAAAEEFDSFLENIWEAGPFHPDQPTDNLSHLFRALTGRLGFLFYAPGGDLELGLMFEVINSRGKPLSQLEKVKNFLIYFANRHSMGDLQNEVNRAWSTILADLNRAGMTDNADERLLLQSCWIAFCDPQARPTQPVYRRLKNAANAYVNNENIKGSYEFLSEFVTFLAHGAKTFRWLHKRDDNSLGQKEARWLEALAFHPRQASILPILVALYYREPDADERIKTLEIIEKLNFRFYVLGIAGRSDSKQAELFRIARDYFGDSQGLSKEFQAQETRKLRESLKDFIRENASLSNMVKNLVLESDEGWDAYTWTGLKFFLASYEQKLAAEHKQTQPLPDLLQSRDPEYNNDFYHREHILPKENLEQLDAPAEESFLCRRLGNFTLVPEGSNISASNARVLDKIGLPKNQRSDHPGYYEQDKAVRLRQVEELGEFLSEAENFVWNKREWQKDSKGVRQERLKFLFDRREEKLVQFALERWHVPEVDPENVPFLHIQSVLFPSSSGKNPVAGSEIWQDESREFPFFTGKSEQEN